MTKDDEQKYWIENNGHKMPADRLFNYTDEKIEEKYKENLDKLKNFPCLFTYEVNHKEETKGHIGSIKSISEYEGYRTQKISIQYELDHTYPEIYIKETDISALQELGINDPSESFELSRGYWAVKNKNLFRFVSKYFLKRCNIKPLPPFDMKRIWGADYINKTLCFLSHKFEYKRQVSRQIKEKLKRKNINCFVAHQDIEPSLKWQKEIIKALDTMHIFIGIVTDDFHTKSWTDQEIGYAYNRGVPRILVKVSNSSPQGFVSSEQALTAKWNNIHKKIVEQILKMDVPFKVFIENNTL